MKYSIPILLGVVLLAAPAAAQAQFAYTTDGSGLTITGYTGPGGSVVIPSGFGSQQVNGIGQDAFSNCTSLISVTIPDTVTSIGWFAFYDCINLTNVMFPASVVSLK
jgi:hypothetical protein